MNNKYLASIIGGTVHTLPTLEDELAKLSKSELCKRWAEYKARGQRCFVLKELHMIRSAPFGTALGKQAPTAVLVYGVLYDWTKASDEKKVA